MPRLPFRGSPLFFEVEESCDALTSKFARVSDIFTQKVLKSFVILTREDAPTFLDRMNLCEKLGLVSSASDLIDIRDLRNMISREYLSEKGIEVYQECLKLSDKLVTAIQSADALLDQAVLGDQG